MKPWPFRIALVALIIPSTPQSETVKPHAIADMIGATAKTIGQANFSQTGHGVIVEIDLHGLPPGPHALHIDNAGVCDARKQFSTAGSHLSFEPRAHGYLARGGPHEGDLPNQFASQDGTLHASVISSAFTLGNGMKSIFRPQGAALVVDATGDDYVTQPFGNSGKRIACGVIRRTIAPGTRRARSQSTHE